MSCMLCNKEYTIDLNKQSLSPDTECSVNPEEQVIAFCVEASPSISDASVIKSYYNYHY